MVPALFNQRDLLNSMIKACDDVEPASHPSLAVFTLLGLQCPITVFGQHGPDRLAAELPKVVMHRTARSKSPLRLCLRRKCQSKHTIDRLNPQPV